MKSQLQIVYCVIALALCNGTTLYGQALNAGTSKSDSSIRIVELKVNPAAEPVPAMSLRLHPSLLERKSGNAVPFYYRAVASLPAKYQDEIRPNIDKWLGTNISALPLEEVKKTLQILQGSLRETSKATRRSYCHWEMPLEDGMSMLLPELSGFRNLIYGVRLQARMQMAEHRLEAALNSLQTMFAMSWDMGQGPTIIQSLVATAMGQMAIQDAELFMQQPGAPNLYWALAMMPKPLVSMREAIEREQQMLTVQFPQLAELDKKIMSAEDARILVEKLAQMLNGWNGEGNYPAKTSPEAVAFVMMVYPQAKAMLLKQGFDPDRIEAMPSPQIALLYIVQVYQKYSQNMFKWFYAPYSVAIEKEQEFVRTMERELSSPNDALLGFLPRMLLPALSRAQSKTCQLDRNIAALRCVEAIRMYAAQNKGKLPQTLGAITAVPVVDNPSTGQQFSYRIEEGKAILEAPPLLGDSARSGLKYIIEILPR